MRCLARWGAASAWKPHHLWKIFAESVPVSPGRVPRINRELIRNARILPVLRFCDSSSTFLSPKGFSGNTSWTEVVKFTLGHRFFCCNRMAGCDVPGNYLYKRHANKDRRGVGPTHWQDPLVPSTALRTQHRQRRGRTNSLCGPEWDQQ